VVPPLLEAISELTSPSLIRVLTVPSGWFKRRGNLGMSEAFVVMRVQSLAAAPGAIQPQPCPDRQSQGLVGLVVSSGLDRGRPPEQRFRLPASSWP